MDHLPQLLAAADVHSSPITIQQIKDIVFSFQIISHFKNLKKSKYFQI
jgi:hypothetical protein